MMVFILGLLLSITQFDDPISLVTFIKKKKATFLLEKIPDGKRKKLCCVFKFSRPVQVNSGGVLTVKLDYVLKGALVDIIPVLIMKNIIDTASY
jgi:hypothetical protein